MKNKPPEPRNFLKYKPSYRWAFYFVLQCFGLTGLGLWLSVQETWVLWLLGQLLLALTLVQWFILMHEAGHQTLFPARWLNHATGHLASLFAAIPYRSWHQIHDRHHQWTGWQDLDSTTASLVPRNLSLVERLLINFFWKFWIPVFSVIYRIQNYYNLPRIKHYVPRSRHLVWMALNIIALLGLYGTTLVLMGWERWLAVFGLARLLAFMIEDPLLLSQHTHMPTQLSSGRPVRPVPALQQATYTRSLIFPRWLSAFWLIHFDAHELHHLYVKVPGYHLHKIDYAPPNAVNWWTWLKGAKSLSGEAFLFQSRDQTGFVL